MLEVRDDLRLAAAAILLAALAALMLGTGRAEAKTTWLCKPGLTDNPCKTGLDTTRVSPTGEVLGVDRIKAAKKPKVDCFYVYPTVSDDEGTNSDLEADPEERSIALYQAARYSEHCRVFAPVYRQITISGIFADGGIDPAVAQLAYSDVAAAWKTYLEDFNDGRGVVLVGHSQGTYMLRQLIAQKIDPKAKVRKRLVSALLFGGNVLTARDQLTGGDFENIPACTEGDETGCAIAFSTFNGFVPESSRYGRPGDDFFGGDPATEEVLCSDPTSLSGQSGALRLVFPSEPFAPGTSIGGATDAVGLPRPQVDTPWIEFPNAYSGGCSSANNANVLQVLDNQGATHLRPVPDASWGLHLVDANIALGNLADIVGDQAKAFAKASKS